jgi:DNA topoisomerase I
MPPKLAPEKIAEELKDPVQSAAVVGLRYVSDDMPGIGRIKAGSGFRYRNPAGEFLHDKAVLQRIDSLAIPPAWTDVWICPDPNGHLQATGRDERRRKQHRYHPRWREVRHETKYARMLVFAKALPQIRRRVKKDLALSGLPRNKVLATVVKLLEVSHIRVGNEEYARENKSYGLTTLRNGHVEVRGSTLRFHFRGKSGKWHNVDIEDQRLARIVRSCQNLPGQELFQYVDDDGTRQKVSSEDVNEYLREITGEDFTAKDFRTWAGTVLAAVTLKEFQKCESQTQAKKNVVEAIKCVAERLGNTVAVCRKCYIHPDVLECYLEGTLVEALRPEAGKELAKAVKGLEPEEAAVVGLLQHRLATEGTRLESALKNSLRREQRQGRTPGGKGQPSAGRSGNSSSDSFAA